jgi:hypothetical protein
VPSVGTKATLPVYGLLNESQTQIVLFTSIVLSVVLYKKD